jgi:hypothetical protein
MPSSTDTLDISLLRNNSHEFVLRSQRIIEYAVKQFIKSGMFVPSEYRDVIQSVNEELIKRLPGIERNFNGTVLLTTYMNVVIRNICYRIHERERTALRTEPLTDAHVHDGEGHIDAILIQEESQRFALAIRLFGSKRHKIILCLKIYFRLPVSDHDLRYCFDAITDSDRTLLLQRFGTNYDSFLETDNFTAIAPFMNRQDNNITSAASLRRWTQEYLTRIIALMNGNPPERAHTKETIKILLEHISL